MMRGRAITRLLPFVRRLPSWQLVCLQALKVNGPLAITIWADSNPSMQFYKAGVYAHPDSPLAGEDHALVLVGWGEEKMVNGTVIPFWIIANSWGNTWWVGGGVAACGGTYL